MFTMLWNEHSILLTSKYYTQCTTLYYTESALLTMDSRVKFVRVPEFRSENHLENPHRSIDRLNLVPKPGYFFEIWEPVYDYYTV